MKKAFAPCKKVGCIQLTRTGYCSEHMIEKKETMKLYNAGRDKEHKRFYNSKQWKEIRKIALMRDSHLCVMCKKEKKVVLADVVDHIVEMKDAFHLRADLENLQSLCNACHNKKTAEEKAKRNNAKL